MAISVASLIDAVLEKEGGFVDHPADRGGPTRYGITQSTLARYKGRPVSREEVRVLEVQVARDIYEKIYYLRPGINLLPEGIQSFVFDSAVHHGPRRAVKFVQSLCNKSGYQPFLDVDGVIGPKTAAAAEWADETYGRYFYAALIEERQACFDAIVRANPSQQVFALGWRNRLDHFRREVRDLYQGVA